MPHELTTLLQLRETIAHWRKGGARVALVPTMGALHRGHLTLVARAKEHADKVVVSIFVNPTQFGPNEDFYRYPRPRARDLALLHEAGADAAWLPEVATMYPEGFATNIHLAGITDLLDGAHRPGHFDGVATVVAKLLLQVMPDIALFGEKDYQQLCVIRRLVADLNIAVEILGVPTVREADGLALSSRNQYLSEAERARAPVLYAALMEVATQLRHTPAPPAEPILRAAAEKLLAAGFASIDYLALHAADTLLPLAAHAPPARLLVAARLGATRLIDNIAC